MQLFERAHFDLADPFAADVILRTQVFQRDGLIGQTVGSQVIVVIPPELGYPEGQSPATIPAGSTMVFVVDILGIEG